MTASTLPFFRPCIDLHDGKVKQIVGSSLRDGETPATNFESNRPASYYAGLYRRDNLRGGHVIMLGPGNEDAAREALAAWPGGMQIGGGITVANALSWLDAGASHVIVTSFVFREGQIDMERLAQIAQLVGPKRLVLDLSCRNTPDGYRVATDRWQKLTSTPVTPETLEALAPWCDEFLVHAVDVEGKQQGVDLDLVRLLSDYSPIPATYAGGVRNLDDMDRVWQAGQGKVGLTIGSALDLFGGPLSYEEAVKKDRQLRMI